MISHIFQSTLPGWGATCEGRTRRRAGRFQSTLPGWGATYLVREGTYGADKFQSTLPGWGATRCSPCPRCGGEFQSTLPGWGATRHGNVEHHRQVISIHAPRMGSDRKGNRLRSRHSKFQSTLPGWGATGVLFEHIQAHNHFNPRSPDGERP